MSALYAFDDADPTISATAMRQHGGIVAACYIVGFPGGYSHVDKARVLALRAAGLAPLPNWERAADFFASATLTECRAAGAEALAAARQEGFPDDGSIDLPASFDYNIPPSKYATAAAELAAFNEGLAGHYRAIAYGPFGFLAYLAAHGQPGPHWLMASTFSTTSQFTAAQVAAPFVGLVQSHDAAGNWLKSPIPGTDINTVTRPGALGAWWPDGSPYGGTVSAQDVITALKSPEGQQLLGQAVAQYRIPNHFKGTPTIETLLAYVDERVLSTDSRTAAAVTDVAALATQLTNLQQQVAAIQTGGIDPVALAKAIADHIDLAAK